jgi:TRAP-type transport system periplasmic protein
VPRWKRTAGTVETDWVNEMKGKGIDGAKLASEARSLIARHAR